VLIAAHGNSLRALVKYLDDMSDAEIMALNIPTGRIYFCTLAVIVYCKTSNRSRVSNTSWVCS